MLTYAISLFVNYKIDGLLQFIQSEEFALWGNPYKR